MSGYAVGFRPMAAGGLVLLAGWLARPHVARWWREPSGLADATGKYLPCIDGHGPARPSTCG